MTKAIHRFVFALICIGASMQAIARSAADSMPLGSPPRTIWDPRVMPASATDENPAVDLYSSAEPESPRTLPPATGDSLSSVYPKPPAQPAPRNDRGHNHQPISFATVHAGL